LRRALVFISFLLLAQFAGFAQQGFYVPKDGKVFFVGDSATIFSDVLNRGLLGLGKKAVIDFKGLNWENDFNSILSDEANNGLSVSGNGGVIRFSASTFRQNLVAGYNAVNRTGPVFSSIVVDNPEGLQLDLSSAKVWNSFNFKQGHVFLNKQVFVVGNFYPGHISGYDSLHYFVTSANADGGILMRENIRKSDGRVDFPIGTSVHAYTPAAVRSDSRSPDNFIASVFDGVYSDATSGSDLQPKSVRKTWEIQKLLRPDEDEVELFLQHLVNDEGTEFAMSRQLSYVSNFSHNSWDKAFPRRTPAAGFLTSGSPLKSSGTNSRAGTFRLSTARYFTKFAQEPRDSSLHTQIQLAARRVNSTQAYVYWQTKPEINVKYFVVERRLFNEAGFTSVDTVLSTADNGLSLDYLRYSSDDPNDYSGISFYRLRVVAYDQTFYYTTTVAIDGSGKYDVVLWPNPTPDKFYLIINSPSAQQVAIYNSLGQKMWSRKIDANAQTCIEVSGHHLLPGVYHVAITDRYSREIRSERLLITPR